MFSWTERLIRDTGASCLEKSLLPSSFEFRAGTRWWPSAELRFADICYRAPGSLHTSSNYVNNSPAKEKWLAYNFRQGYWAAETISIFPKSHFFEGIFSGPQLVYTPSCTLDYKVSSCSFPLTRREVNVGWNQALQRLDWQSAGWISTCRLKSVHGGLTLG